MRFRAIYFTVLLMLPVISTAQARSCADLFSVAYPFQSFIKKLDTEWSRDRIEKEARSFDFEKYESARAEFTHQTRPPDSSLEEKIAWVEVHSPEFLKNRLSLEQVLSGDDWIQKRRLLGLFRSTKWEEQLSEKGIENFVTRLYLIIAGPEPHLFDLFLAGKTDPIFESSLRRMLEKKIMKEGLFRFAETNGMVMAPRFHERVLKFLGNEKFRFSLDSYATLLFFSGHVSPLILPEIRWVNVPPAWIQDALEKGFDQAWPAAKETWLRGFSEEQIYNSMRKTFITVSTGILAVIALDDILAKISHIQKSGKSEADSLEKLTEAADQNSIELRKKLDEKQRVGKELFTQWQKNWENKHGKPADPQSKEYQEAYRVFISTRRE